MTPTPNAQQQLDALEKVGKIVGTVLVLVGAVAGLVRWLRKRKENRDARYAARIERIVRAAFSKELADMTAAVKTVGTMSGQVDTNTTAIAAINSAIVSHLSAGDELTTLVVGLVRENREWLDDLQTFVDHAYQIDRRSSVGQDRRQRIDEKFDAIEERRHQRRRVTDGLRDGLAKPDTPP
jgi:hypothetical protein